MRINRSCCRLMVWELVGLPACSPAGTKAARIAGFACFGAGPGDEDTQSRVAAAEVVLRGAAPGWGR